VASSAITRSDTSPLYPAPSAAVDPRPALAYTPSVVRWLLPLQSLVLAVLLTWPAVLWFDQAAVGSPDGDGAKHLWTLWWMAAEWDRGEPGLLTTLVNWPKGMELWPIEPLNGVLAALIPLDPIPLSNLLAIVHVTLVGVCAGALGMVASRRPAGAYVAGALAQGCAFTSFALQVGVGELRQYWLLPLGLLLAVQARETTRARWFIGLGAFMGVATVACFYHGFFLALSVAVYALVTLRREAWLLTRWALAAVIALALVLGPIRDFSRRYAPSDNPDTISFSEWMEATSRTRLETYPTAAASPDELVVPRSSLRADADGQVRAYTGGRYLGLVTLGLAALGVYAARRRALPWLWIALPPLVLSFGSVLWLRGEVVEIGGGRIVLPLAWLNRVLGYYVEPMNFPARFLAVPMLCLAVLAAQATRYRWTLFLVPIAVIDMVEGDLVDWPRRMFTLPSVAGLERVDGSGAVANLTPLTQRGAPPTDRVGDSVFARRNPEDRARAIAVQLALEAPAESLPVDRMEFWAPDGLLYLQALPLSTGLRSPNGPADLRESAFLLRDVGFDRIVLTHKTQNAADEALAALLRPTFGAPVDAGAASIWRVPEVVVSEEEATAWRAAQAQRVRELPVPRPGVQFPGQ